jgi:hypothetical protein
MKTIIATAAIVAVIAMPAHAGNEGVHGFICAALGRSGILTVDENKGTLTWQWRAAAPYESRGSRTETFRDLKTVEGCKVKYQATHDAVTAVLCTYTHGVANLKIGEASFDCIMERGTVVDPPMPSEPP